MSFEFKPYVMKDGKFGPTPNGHFYMPMPYHNPTAARRANKSRWILDPGQQYNVFELADTPLGDRVNWMNDDESGLYGMLDSCRMVLGKDGDERLAFFPATRNEADPWHGYPVDSLEIGEDLIAFWFDQQLIDRITYTRLMRHEL